ncbi:hypothetical protein HDU82_006618, partial [Entophlyctis luteolus]
MADIDLPALVDQVAALLRAGAGTEGSEAVSVRLLCRVADISPALARSCLESYKNANPQSVHASYLLVGQLSGDNELASETVVRVVPEEAVDEVKANYSTYSLSIYSVENGSINVCDYGEALFFKRVQNIYDVLANIEANPRTGCSSKVLNNAAIKYTDRPLFAKNVSAATTTADLKPSFEVSVNLPVTLSRESTSSVTSSSALTKPMAYPANKKQKTVQKQTASPSGFFDTQIKRDEEKKQKQAQLQAAKLAERERTAAKIRADAVKDSIANRDIDMKLQNMFDEEGHATGINDGGDEDDSETDNDEHETKRLKLMAHLSAEVDSEVSVEDNDDALEGQPMVLEETKADQLLQQPDIEFTKARIRRRRKIKKQITVAEGKYMLTRDVSDWESYSEDEDVPVRKSLPKNIGPSVPLDAPLSIEPAEANLQTKKSSPTKLNSKSKSGKKNAGQGQTLISSFFK